MAELATLARPYAGAVFELAKRELALDRWSRMLEVLSVATADPKVGLVLDAPDVAEEQKAFRLIDVCGDELNVAARKFVQVLAANKRLDLIDAIAEQFEILRSEEQRALDVAVVSAYPLSTEQSGSLKSALQRRFDKTVNLESKVDASLIGGAVIRAGDVVIDGSLRGKLEKLGETLGRS